MTQAVVKKIKQRSIEDIAKATTQIEGLTLK